MSHDLPAPPVAGAPYAVGPTPPPPPRGMRPWQVVLIVLGVLVAVLVTVVAAIVVPSLLDERVDVGDEGRIITEADLEADGYVSVLVANQYEHDLSSGLSVHRLPMEIDTDYGASDQWANSYASSTGGARAVFNVYRLDNPTDEAAVVARATEIAGRLDDQLGLGGVGEFSAAETNHSGDIRLGVEHVAGPGTGVQRAMTVFNVSSNKLVAATIVLTDVEYTSDRARALDEQAYYQAAITALEVKAQSDMWAED